jgi:rSAM/selenodomain-associated transferase 1
MVYQYPNACLIVFCKAPVPGQVKTRLSPELSSEQAAVAHRKLTQRLLDWLLQAALCPIQLWCSPNTEHAFFQQCVEDYGVTLYQQCDGDLGVKMDHALQSSLKHFDRALLIGCDCPSLSEADIQQALADLKHYDVVLSPAEDGGYVMIGCDYPQPMLFNDITWGSNQVLSATLDRVETLDLRYKLTELQWDVDTFSDWQRFCQMK